MVMVPSLEMSLSVFVWDRGELHACVFGVLVGYGCLLVSIGQRWRFSPWLRFCLLARLLFSCRKGELFDN
jgi:hypothetical protein